MVAPGGPAPPDPVDAIWLRLRRPFPYPRSGHQCEWERYDADRAGCTRCGALHRCAAGMVGCTCPLAETDDGGHTCTITGLCISEVRASRCEYVEHVSFDAGHAAAARRASEDDEVHDRVRCVVENFLLSPATAVCRETERRKYAQKQQQAFWRVLKQRKRDYPYRLPDLCSVVAEVVQLEPPPRSLLPLPSGGAGHTPASVAEQSARCVAAAVLQVYRMGFRKIYQGSKFDSMVIGMLYMSRTGLLAGDAFRLPAVPHIGQLLPSEAYLNCLGVSNKVICDTENEIKSCIRVFSESQAALPGACAPPAKATKRHRARCHQAARAPDRADRHALLPNPHPHRPAGVSTFASFSARSRRPAPSS